MLINPSRFADFNFENEVGSANCLFWLEAGEACENAAGVPATEGQTIQFWRDFSSNGNDWEQSGASFRPVFDADAGSKFNNGPAVFNEGSSGDIRGFGGPNLSSETAGEIFILLFLESNTPAAADSGFWKFGTATFNTVIPWTDGNAYDGFGTNSRKSTGNPADDFSSSVIYNVISTSSEWTSKINSATVNHFTTATNTVAFSSTPFLGSSFSSASFQMDGRIAACVMYDGKLSSGDRTKVYDALDATRS